MKPAYKILIGTSVGIGIYAAWKSFSLNNTVNDLQLKIKSVKVNLPKIYLTLQLFNPTRNEVIIDSVVGTVKYNDKEIGSIQYINKTPIAAMNYTVLSNVLVDLNTFGLLLTAGNAISDNSKSVISFQGNIYYKGIPFPFNQSINVFKMFQKQPITISQVSNGWIVVLPRSYQHPVPVVSNDQIRLMARTMMDEAEKDPLLSEIKADSEPAELNISEETEEFEMDKENNIHIFKTFPEVISFLNYKIKE